MKIFKIVVDILLLVDTVLLSSVEYFGVLVHEILGISMVVLLLLHIVTHWNWIKNVTKNLKEVNQKTKLMYVVNILTMIVYFGAVLFGVMISREIFKFKTGRSYSFIVTHQIFGRLAMIVMFLHVGFHLDTMFHGIKSKKIRIVLYCLYIATAIFCSIYSIYKLTHSFAWAMTFGM